MRDYLNHTPLFSRVLINSFKATLRVSLLSSTKFYISNHFPGNKISIRLETIIFRKVRSKKLNIFHTSCAKRKNALGNQEKIW